MSTLVYNPKRAHALACLQVFCMKLPFDYFVMAQPARDPLILVQQRGWLECGEGSYGGRNWCVLGSVTLIFCHPAAPPLSLVL